MPRFAFLLILLLMFSACRKDAQVEGTVVDLPVDGPVRVARVLNGTVYLGGGRVEGKGFFCSFDPAAETATLLTDTFAGPAYQLNYFNDRFMCATNRARIYYTGDFTQFVEFVYLGDNGIPTLNQQPIYAMEVSPGGKVFTAAGGALRYGLIQESPDSLRNWFPSTFNNELRSIHFPTATTGYA